MYRDSFWRKWCFFAGARDQRTTLTKEEICAPAIQQHLRKIFDNLEISFAENIACLRPAGDNKALTVDFSSNDLHSSRTCLRSPSYGFASAKLKIFELNNRNIRRAVENVCYILNLDVFPNCLAMECHSKKDRP